MLTTQYPRNPKYEMNGLCYLVRLIDKFACTMPGQIQNYHYPMTGFDRYLLDKLELQRAD